MKLMLIAVEDRNVDAAHTVLQGLVIGDTEFDVRGWQTAEAGVLEDALTYASSKLGTLLGRNLQSRWRAAHSFAPMEDE